MDDDTKRLVAVGEKALAVMDSRRPSLRSRMLSIGLMASMMDPGAARELEDLLPQRDDRTPWARIRLSKAERKGKSAAEIQALRRQKYEASNPPASGIKHPNRRDTMGFKEILAAVRETIKEGVDFAEAEGQAIEQAAIIKIRSAKLALAETGLHLTEMAESGIHELDEHTLMYLEAALSKLETEEQAIMEKLQPAPAVADTGSVASEASDSVAQEVASAPAEPAQEAKGDASTPVDVPL
jgi:hypothetical protein